MGNACEGNKSQAPERGELEIQKEIKQEEEEIKIPQGHEPLPETATPIENFPELLPVVDEVHRTLPPFEFEGNPNDIDLPSLGPHKLNNDLYYEGQWKCGFRQGSGKQLFLDNSLYVGNFKEDQPHGKGRMIHNNGDYYEGEWKCNKYLLILLDGKKDGYGVYRHYGKLTEYEGCWWADMQHGFGKEIFKDGSRFEGLYFKGVKEGKGSYLWTDGSKYIGDFKNNQFNGNGTMYWPEQKVYEGEWKNNMIHGYGVIKWEDGFEFRGHFENDKKHGQGEFVWPDGKKYITDWHSGLQNGKATYLLPNDKKREELWENGKRVRVLVDEIEFEDGPPSEIKMLYESKRMASPEKFEREKEEEKNDMFVDKNANLIQSEYLENK